MAQTYVAVVDDEASVRVALGRLLRLADCEVAAFASGEEFLNSITGHVPDCVLLDIHMPGLSGLQVMARMTSARAGLAHLPVVVITASDNPEIARIALDAGASRVLHKPFSNQELLEAIGGAVRV